MAEQAGLGYCLDERSLVRRIGLALPSSALRLESGLFGLLLLGQLAYLASGIGQVVNAYDEGFAVYGAARILAGDLPYRDFWAIYAPGQFYALAALYQVFGETLLTERLWDTVARFVLALLVYLVTARLTSPRVAVVPGVLATIWLGAADYYGYAVFPALACSLLNVLALLRYVVTRRGHWLAAGGAAVGVATLFRHDLGAYAFLSGSLMLATYALLGGVRPRRTLAAAGLEIARTELGFTLGTLLVVLPVAAYFLAQVPPHVLWSDLVLFPVFINRQISYLPYPALLPDLGPLSRLDVGRYLQQVIDPWVRFYTPLVVFAMAGAVLTVGPRSAEQRRSVRTWGVLLLVLLGLAMFNHTLNRFDRMHALPSAMVALILLTVLVADLRGRWRRLPAMFVVAPVLVLLGVSYVVLPVNVSLGRLQAFPPWVCHSPVQRAGCADLYPDQEQALDYVGRHTAPGERIFVGNVRHDRVYASDVLFYFLADRHSPSRFHELVGAVANTLPVQRQIVDDLNRRDVRYVVLSEAFESLEEPNLSNAHSGVTMLDDFIRAHYARVAEFGAYTIWQRTQ
jgi:hypothetical protein